MNSIGGYFELELRKGKGFHPNAIALNTGRNAFEYILKIYKYKKVYIPFYTCDVILEPLKKTNTSYEFYYIDKNFEPIFDYSIIQNKEAFLYTNYFGLKDIFISTLVKNCNNLIIDNSQSFFSRPEKCIPTFYSCRKFFGIPDGSYLYLDGKVNLDLPLDHSENRFAHLMKRIEYGAEQGYYDFKKNDISFTNQPIKLMSKLTTALLCNIDYKFVQKKRVENFIYLHEKLSKYNELEINLCKKTIPMVYPFLINKPELKQKFFENKIFIATYWPNVLKWLNKDKIENIYAENIMAIPIDQRNSKQEMDIIVNLILQ